ncbi:hypothetical protein TGFOU_223490 [Toxoplasma gondii FOU]|uniref:Coiled-coil domain-containing protein 86 n=3 Tax=Toxoplasma gondii TaxID=5811 RepID=A0A086LB29_TOXGO|nr:hypothetical protein TGFOU_223490 [Toxoplasma gondii FOU]PUA91455.1 hypothetical protein TGBR9_223490 [Toxoplasma gondii TgCATBr9]RQX68292.1 hypothetical protein TGCAST_223490 [Toxoplasma gondii CAST]
MEARDPSKASRRLSAQQKLEEAVVSPFENSEATARLSVPPDSPRSERRNSLSRNLEGEKGASLPSAGAEPSDGASQRNASQGRQTQQAERENPSTSSSSSRDSGSQEQQGEEAQQRRSSTRSTDMSGDAEGQLSQKAESRVEGEGQGEGDAGQPKEVCGEEEMGDDTEGGCQAEESSSAQANVPGTMGARIPRSRGRQAWREKGTVRSFGRFCKEAANRNKGSWESQKQARDQQKAMRQAELEMRQERSAVLRRRREKTEEKRRRKEENALKSSQVQVIKNTAKLRKWGKKARRDLVKMSPEMIQKLYNVRL